MYFFYCCKNKFKKIKKRRIYINENRLGDRRRSISYPYHWPYDVPNSIYSNCVWTLSLLWSLLIIESDPSQPTLSVWNCIACTSCALSVWLCVECMKSLPIIRISLRCDWYFEFKFHFFWSLFTLTLICQIVSQTRNSEFGVWLHIEKVLCIPQCLIAINFFSWLFLGNVVQCNINKILA